MMTSALPNLPQRRFYLLFLGLLVIGIAIVGIILWWQNQSNYTVIITINGHIQEINTSAKTVGEAIDDANILIDKADHIEPPLNRPLTDGMTITITKAQQLVLDYNGQIQRVYTHENDPYQILREQNIMLSSNDTFLVNYRPANNISNGETIRHLKIISAKRYTIVEDNIVIAEGTSTVATVGALLAELNIPLYVADEITPAVNQPFVDNLTIEIQRSIPITIVADSKRIMTRATGETVYDAINSAGFPLSGQDYTIPNSDTPLQANMVIEIVRVLETVEEQHQIIPYRTLYYPTPELPAGQQEVIQIGIEGLQVTQIRTRYENNQIVSRVQSVPWIVQPPTHQIIIYGIR